MWMTLRCPSRGLRQAAVVFLAAAGLHCRAEDTPAAATPAAVTAPAPAVPDAAAPTSSPAAAPAVDTAKEVFFTQTNNNLIVSFLNQPTERITQLREILERLEKMTPEERKALAEVIQTQRELVRQVSEGLMAEQRALSPRDRDVLRRYFASLYPDAAQAWLDRLKLETTPALHQIIIRDMLTAAAARNLEPNPKLSDKPGDNNPPGPRGDPNPGDRPRGGPGAPGFGSGFGPDGGGRPGGVPPPRPNRGGSDAFAPKYAPPAAPATPAQ